MKRALFTIMLFATACSSVSFDSSEGAEAPQVPATIVPVTAAPVSAAPATFVDQPCDEWDDTSQRCGYLDVAEIRGDRSDGDRVHLDVTITAERPGDRPVLLVGHLGFDTVVETLSDHRQVIRVATRGSTEAVPSLRCYWIEDAEVAEHFERCRTGFERAGIDQDHYGVSASALDLVDLLDTLDVGEVDVVGFATAALIVGELQRIAAQRLGATVVVEPFLDHVSDVTVSRARLRSIATRCEAEPSCASVGANLEARVDQLLQELDSTPLVIPETDLVDEFDFDAEWLVDAMDQLFSSPPGAATVIALVEALERGDVDYVRDVVGFTRSFSGDVHLIAMMCSIPITEAADLSAGWQLVQDRFAATWADICATWPVPAVDGGVEASAAIGSAHYLPAETSIDLLGALSSPCTDEELLVALEISTERSDACSVGRATIVVGAEQDRIPYEISVDWGTPITYSGTRLAAWTERTWASFDRGADVLDPMSISFDWWALDGADVVADLPFSWETEPLTEAPPVGTWQVFQARSTWQEVRHTFAITDLGPESTAVIGFTSPLDEVAAADLEIERFLLDASVSVD